jgi:hypothetical protein
VARSGRKPISPRTTWSSARSSWPCESIWSVYAPCLTHDSAGVYSQAPNTQEMGARFSKLVIVH